MGTPLNHCTVGLWRPTANDRMSGAVGVGGWIIGLTRLVLPDCCCHPSLQLGHSLHGSDVAGLWNASDDQQGQTARHHCSGGSATSPDSVPSVRLTLCEPNADRQRRHPRKCRPSSHFAARAGPLHSQGLRSRVCPWPSRRRSLLLRRSSPTSADRHDCDNARLTRRHRIEPCVWRCACDARCPHSSGRDSGSRKTPDGTSLAARAGTAQ